MNIKIYEKFIKDIFNNFFKKINEIMVLIFSLD